MERSLFRSTEKLVLYCGSQTAICFFDYFVKNMIFKQHINGCLCLLLVKHIFKSLNKPQKAAILKVGWLKIILCKACKQISNKKKEPMCVFSPTVLFYYNGVQLRF